MIAAAVMTPSRALVPFATPQTFSARVVASRHVLRARQIDFSRSAARTGPQARFRARSTHPSVTDLRRHIRMEIHKNIILT